MISIITPLKQMNARSSRHQNYSNTWVFLLKVQLLLKVTFTSFFNEHLEMKDPFDKNLTQQLSTKTIFCHFPRNLKFGPIFEQLFNYLVSISDKFRAVRKNWIASNGYKWGGGGRRCGRGRVCASLPAVPGLIPISDCW